jgi:hypothetical protein
MVLLSVLCLQHYCSPLALADFLGKYTRLRKISLYHYMELSIVSPSFSSSLVSELSLGELHSHISRSSHYRITDTFPPYLPLRRHLRTTSDWRPERAWPYSACLRYSSQSLHPSFLPIPLLVCLTSPTTQASLLCLTALSTSLDSCFYDKFPVHLIQRTGAEAQDDPISPPENENTPLITASTRKL